jgi:tocopherol O-methyltransferase
LVLGLHRAAAGLSQNRSFAAIMFFFCNVGLHFSRWLKNGPVSRQILRRADTETLVDPAKSFIATGLQIAVTSAEAAYDGVPARSRVSKRITALISAESQFDATVVANHYNELDVFYRELWGEHVHHGLWVSGQEIPEIAVRHLVDVVAQEAQIKPGDQVIDIGCGYGAAARQLAQDYGAQVTAITLSSAQHAYAQSVTAGTNPAYLVADWLTTDFPPEFRAAIAIESSEHMPDRDEFFRRAYDVLEVGGHFVVCAWLSRETPSPFEIAWLLRPICDEGRVPHLPTLNELIASAKAAGFELVKAQDCTQSVRRTWGIILRRMIGRLLTDSRYRAFLLDERRRNRIFALTVIRLWLAYWVGAMRYGVVTLERKR